MQDEPTDGIDPSEPTEPTSEPSAGAETEPSSEHSRRWRRHLVLALPTVTVLLAMGAYLALRTEEPPVTTTTTTSTSTTTSTTTTTIPVLPSGTFEVATARPEVTSLEVRATAPEGWEDAPPSVRSEPYELPPASQATAPERPALPRLDYPIVGRDAIVGGWRFANPGPYEPSQPFTMLVSERRGEWVKVHVPVRPNGSQGWVRRSQVDLGLTQHRIEVRLGERMLRAYDGERELVATPVVIGAPSTPTPTGLFYLTDKVPQPNPGGAYGPVALATDGYSEAMDYFSTGVPVIALHGTNRPELVGRAVANGCVRMPNEVVQQLADVLPLGTPVLIWP